MRKWLTLLEKSVDKLIIPSLVVIASIVFSELLFPEFAYKIHKEILVLDSIVISIFVIDLGFKLYRASNWEGFLREHWLEIVAILPFFIVFRIVEGVFLAIDTIEKGQHIAHLAEGARSGRFAAFFGSAEITRSTRLGSFIRALARSPRLAKAATFFESPEHSSPFS